MSTAPKLPAGYGKQKSFWKRPEGITGTIFLVGIIAALVFIITSINWALIFASTAYMAATAALLFAIFYMIFDPKMRQMVGYGYKSAMRGITSMFVKVDPIGVLKSYVDDLEDNLLKMNAQINKLRGQMHQLKELIKENERGIDTNMRIAQQARKQDKTDVITLKTRKAARLKDSNARLGELYRKMEVLYRVLDRMYRNGEILVEDVRDQVQIKEQERKAIRASHSAMQSAATVMGEDKDSKFMYDQAVEAIAEDVSAKVGEMERFMEMSATIMDSVDLQNGDFEDRGLEMLKQWEREGESKLLSKEEKQHLLTEANDDANILNIDTPRPEPVVRTQSSGGSKKTDSKYDDFLNN